MLMKGIFTMDLPSGFLILISNEKMTTWITTRRQLPSGPCSPCQEASSGTRTSVSINHGSQLLHIPGT